MNEKKRRVIIIISVIATLVVAFLIYWKATEHDRYIKGCIDDVREEILDYRSGASSDIYFWVSSSEMEDHTYIDFLSTQVSEMIDNAEYNLLYKFLKRLELEDAYISGIKNDVTNLFNSVGDLKAALEIKDKLEYLLLTSKQMESKKSAQRLEQDIMPTKKMKAPSKEWVFRHPLYMTLQVQHIKATLKLKVNMAWN